MKRIFLIVLDSFGIGAMPDSESFGDVGVNTLAACATSSKLNIPNMIAAGLGNIDGVECLPKEESPIGAYARLSEASMGKDTTIEAIGKLPVWCLKIPCPLILRDSQRKCWRLLRQLPAAEFWPMRPGVAPQFWMNLARSICAPVT